MSRRIDAAHVTPLMQFCRTDRQREVLEAIAKAGSIAAAAKDLGVNRSMPVRTVQAVETIAIRQGWSPNHDLTNPVPVGYKVKGASTLYDAEGKITAQWVKSESDSDTQRRAMEEYVSALCEDVKPRKPKKAKQIKHDPDLMVGYPLGDHHWGMYSHALETGADYDLDIAKENLSNAIDYLVDRSPSSETALFCNLGDAFHINDRTNKTPASGHLLDADGRFGKVVEAAAFGFSYAINKLLAHHKTVHVVHLPGNHDPDAALWLQMVTRAWFRNEPRVVVDTSLSDFRYHQFGQNMIGMNHGHKIKLEHLHEIMAAQMPDMWGATKYRVGWTGHVHHSQKLAAKEYRGAKAESFGVLPPNDAHGASHGYLAYREMQAITFRRSGGEMGRVTYNVDLS